MRPLSELLEEGTASLLAAGVENARYDAEELLIYASGCSRTELLTRPEHPVSEETEANYKDLIDRRADRFPLQYLLGEWDFYDRSFTVREGVLIPRPETELLVETALAYLREHHGEENPATVLDLCSGSGCVGITVERNFPHCSVIAVELSDSACDVIRANMARNETERFELRQGDLFDGPEALGIVSADLILANPPYLTAEEMQALQEEIGHEPELALFGGDDGLRFYRCIAADWANVLREGGLCAVEIGEQQGADVASLFADFSDNIRVLKDFSDHPRVVLAEHRFCLTI